ncbi:MAG: hypothetical protein PHY56_07175 [Candidatus Omnitrophica bacterium]|nr:hypothetical protein [Candidatus Omnitrophota bacterium]
MIRKRKGLVLVAAVMLVIFVSIAVLGLSVFIVSWYRQIDSAERQERCVYNASAGINYALYQYRNSSSLTNNSFNIDASNSFTVSTVVEGGSSGAAAALVLNATNAHLGSNNRRLLQVTIRNSSSSPVTIDRMIVTWNISNRTMSQIRINNSTVWSGSASSGQIVNINNTTIPPNTTLPINLIQFNSNMSSAIITLSFVMTDGNTTSACTAWPAQGAVCVQLATGLTIKSMGKTAGSNQYRSVQATYNITSGNISDYDEINQVVP